MSNYSHKGDWTMGKRSQTQTLCARNKMQRKTYPIREASKSSTKLCRHFLQGRCTWGKDCKFSHDYDYFSRILHRQSNQNIKKCIFFERGYCRFGEECTYFHDSRRIDKSSRQKRNTCHSSNSRTYNNYYQSERSTYDNSRSERSKKRKTLASSDEEYNMEEEEESESEESEGEEGTEIGWHWALRNKGSMLRLFLQVLPHKDILPIIFDYMKHDWDEWIQSALDHTLHFRFHAKYKILEIIVKYLGIPEEDDSSKREISNEETGVYDTYHSWKYSSDYSYRSRYIIHESFTSEKGYNFDFDVDYDYDYRRPKLKKFL